MLSCRPAVLADAQQIVALVNSAYRGDSSRAGWTTEADLLEGQRTDVNEVSNLIAAADSLLLLCVDNDEIIGTAHLQHGHDAAYLGMLVIKPGLQGQGLGRQFMQAAETTAIKMWSVHRMRMYVITRRQELLAFYERCGYRRSGKFRKFPQDARFGIPKVAGLQLELMEKTL